MKKKKIKSHYRNRLWLCACGHLNLVKINSKRNVYYSSIQLPCTLNLKIKQNKIELRPNTACNCPLLSQTRVFKSQIRSPRKWITQKGLLKRFFFCQAIIFQIDFKLNPLYYHCTCARAHVLWWYLWKQSLNMLLSSLFPLSVCVFILIS